jgi:mannose-1-phosphate guanylyltransferase
VILPADHHVCAESILRQRLQDALAQLDNDDAPPTLLGLSPDRIDTDLGYIVPSADGRNVARFIEKPDRDKARDSITDGALWNTFIMTTPVRSLVRLFMKCYSVLVLEAIVNTALQATPAGAGWQLLVDMYDRLPNIDFSKDLLQKQPDALRVLCVPECGWSDLGTPNRLGETLRRLQPQSADSPAAPFLDLAAQHALYENHMASAVTVRPS